MTAGRVPGWDKKIAEAQLSTHATIGDATHERVKYGQEHSNCRPKCWNCGVALGQYHVSGCSVEVCPLCGDQALGGGCGCHEAAEAPLQ